MLPQGGVQERRLADVRAPEDRHGSESIDGHQRCRLSGKGRSFVRGRAPERGRSGPLAPWPYSAKVRAAMIRDDSGPSGGGSGSGAERPVEGRRRIVGAWLTAAAVAVLSLLVPIASSGIWDPHELGVADLSRRIALTLMGAEGLSLSGGNNSVPSLGELGRGQLPFTSIATGFRVFGLHDWAGRLPLALWGLLGVAATYALVARLVSRKAACFSAAALATMPLYFRSEEHTSELQSRENLVCRLLLEKKTQRTL